MIEINLHEVDLNLVTNRESGARTLRFVDEQSGIVVRVDFQEENALQLAAALTGSGIEVVPASGLPQAEVRH